MASEGLDIKTLTTLIMASPKTDVCQSVGRILRTKHSSPMVVDIVDSHDIFEKQWQKRRQYYMKQKYNIISCDNTTYMKNVIENTYAMWQTVYDPLKNEESIKKIKKKDEPLKGVCLIKL
jgi:superfamily II DNA or RNA helicase